MKLAFFEAEDWAAEKIRAAFPEDEVALYPGRLAADSLPEVRDIEIAVVFIDSRVDRAVLEALPGLKCVATRSTGYDHIDVAACKERGVAALYVPGYGDNTVAEYAFGLIIALMRKMYQSIDQVKETGSFTLAGLRGTDLKGKTIGVIGTGRIGKDVVRIAKGFGMNVVAYDPFPDAQFAAAQGMAYLGLDDLLAGSDVVTIHCPYTKDTHHLIGTANMGRIKRGAYLVNTARGAIVETEALVAALEAGTLAGAALDVLEEEGETKDEVTFLRTAHPKEDELRTLLENHVLMKMPNVLITPHNAFNSQEALERILATTIDNIHSFIGGTPKNIIA